MIWNQSFEIQSIEKKTSDIIASSVILYTILHSFEYRLFHLLSLDTLAVEAVDESWSSNPVSLNVTEQKIELTRLENLKYEKKR